MFLLPRVIGLDLLSFCITLNLSHVLFILSHLKNREDHELMLNFLNGVSGSRKPFVLIKNDEPYPAAFTPARSSVLISTLISARECLTICKIFLLLHALPKKKKKKAGRILPLHHSQHNSGVWLGWPALSHVCCICD